MNNCYSSGCYLAFLTAICLVLATELFLDNLKGFASLEAKRKFRAPRSSPDDPSPVSSSSLSPDEGTSVDDAFGKTNVSASSLGLHEHVSVDDAVCTTNCSKSILLYPENNGNTPHSDSVSFLNGSLLINHPYKYFDIISCPCFL